MIIPPSSRKMTISRSRYDDTFVCVTTVIVFAFVLFAIVNLCNGGALIASSLWIILVTIWNWAQCREQGGFRRFLINWMGGLAGRRFVEVGAVDASPRNVHFGFELFGYCFIQKSIPLNSIETVEWSTGQATSMAGHDRNDWRICIWFDQDDTIKIENKKKRGYRKPDQDIYCVGPSACKSKTEDLGLSLVAFLRDAGADLVLSDTTTYFVKRRHAGEGKSPQHGEAALRYRAD